MMICWFGPGTEGNAEEKQPKWLRAKEIVLEEKWEEPDVVIYWLNDLRGLWKPLASIWESDESKQCEEEKWVVIERDRRIYCVFSIELWKLTREGLENP